MTQHDHHAPAPPKTPAKKAPPAKQPAAAEEHTMAEDAKGALKTKKAGAVTAPGQTPDAKAAELSTAALRPRPHKGGSYIRDRDGALRRQEFTQPTPARAKQEG